jgi:S1-C subfamily serine protease
MSLVSCVSFKEDDAMFRPDANDQSKAPYRLVSHTPWPPAEDQRPNQPVEGTYQSGGNAAQLSGDDPTQPVVYQEYPPQWNPPGKLVAAPSMAPAARGLRTASILTLAMVMVTIFGVGLFAGWDFARSGFSGPMASVVPPLQSRTSSTQAVPPLTSSNIQTVREAAIAKVSPTVVQVNVTVIDRRGQQAVQSGSGVIVDKRGYIVTNNHVVQGGQSIEVVFADGNKIENVQVAGTDPKDDLAVLKVNPPTNMVVATLGDSSKLKVGEEVLAIGNPLGITETVTHGIISALGRSVSDNATTIPNAIQTDAAINPGNSGGALADLQGNVIGIPTLAAIDPEFNAPANGVGFAIPINQVKLIVPQIIQNGTVTHTGRAALGISGQDVSDLQGMYNLPVNYGVFVTGVQSNGPAAQAGLQQGDVIVAIDGQEIDNNASLGDVLATKAPGNKVSVSVYRGNQQLTFTVTLDELQAS